jgi:hypothetical protein
MGIEIKLGDKVRRIVKGRTTPVGYEFIVKEIRKSIFDKKFLCRCHKGKLHYVSNLELVDDIEWE